MKENRETPRDFKKTPICGKGFGGVIFDLDGTLIDSKEDLADATNRVLKEEGFEGWPVEQYKIFLGKGIRNLVLNALPEENRDPETVERCRSKIMDDYGKHYWVKTCLYPGIGEMLDELSAKGLKLNVLSNKPHEITCKIMAEMFARWNFCCVFGAEEGSPMKPDPQAVFRICRISGVSPSSMLYVGDSDVDMQTAENAGIKAIGVSWGFRYREELIRAGAWKIADKAEEIVRIVDRSFECF